MTLYIIIGVFMLIIGAVVGGLAAALILGRDSGSQPVSSGKAKSYQELVQVWRNRETGKLVLEAGGKLYDSVDELDEKTRGRMKLISEKFGEFLGLAEVAKSAGQNVKTMRADGVENEDTRKEQEEIAEINASAAERLKDLDFLQPPPEEENPQPVQQRVPDFSGESHKPEDFQAEVEEESKPKSMVGQIDEILQTLLPLSPVADKHIKLSEDPGKGVTVWVGMDRYEAIDDVPDKDVRILLKAAVAEWEKRAEVRRSSY